MRLLLASASPRRADLLRAAGFSFDATAVDLDERVQPGEAPDAYVKRLATEKAGRALERIGPARAGHIDSPAQAGHYVQTSDLVILAADTAVVVDGAILGKPKDDLDSAAMLGRLSGRRHEVMTGVCLKRPGSESTRIAVTSVEFSRLSPEDIAWYVASGEGRDKAGAYAIQGLGSRFIPWIEGSYSNVVGLPISLVHELLAEIASGGRSRIF